MKIRITPAHRLWLMSAWYKYEYFKNKNMLPADNSFFYKDEDWARELSVCRKTIKRAREFWKQCGVIAFESGRYRQNATTYRILKKPDKKSPFILLEELIKNDIASKQKDNTSLEGDNFSPNEGQNDPTNNLINNNKNKETNKPAIAALLFEKTVIKDQYLLDTLVNRLGIQTVKDKIERSEIILEGGVSIGNHTG